MNGIPLWRRCAIALVALLIAGYAFRGQLAGSLVSRGDDALRNGDPVASVRYYARALAVDAASVRAADRLAFALDLSRVPGAAATAVAVAGAALRYAPDDPTLLADRGLAEERLALWAAAERDLSRAGSVGRDARYDHLAARVALRNGRPEDARRLFRRALVADPAFAPARAALAHLR